MQISEHIYSTRVIFTGQLPGGLIVSRFVNLFLVAGKRLNLIDAGIAGSEDKIWAMVDECGRGRDIERLLLTHAHPDHIGAAKGLKDTLHCRIAA